MLVSELINEAWYLSSIVARDLETVSGSQSADGLRILNNLLAEKSITGRYIPYTSHLTIPCEVGVAEYSIPGLVDVDTVTFNLGTVRYPMIRSSVRRFFGTGRIDNIETLPWQYYVERELGGSKIYLYYSPNETYPLNISGKFALSEVEMGQDLNDSLDRFYQIYLQHQLADRMCKFYGLQLNPGVQQTLDTLDKQINNVAPRDYTITKYSTLGSTETFNWGQINLGKGWTT